MRLKTALVTGLLLAFTAACAGEDDDGVATAGEADEDTSVEAEGSGPEDDFEEALAYAQCMRDNGIEGFPDPELSDGGGISQVGPEGDVDAGALEDAEAACEDFLPGAGDGGNEIDPEGEQLMFEYSQCMRDNGIEEFPDPGADGGITIDSDTLGVDPTGPEMRAAEEACQEIIGGEGSTEERTEDS